MKDHQGNEVFDGMNGFSIEDPKFGWSVRNGDPVKHGTTTEIKSTKPHVRMYIGNYEYVDITGFRYARCASDDKDSWFEGSGDMKTWTRLVVKSVIDDKDSLTNTKD